MKQATHIMHSELPPQPSGRYRLRMQHDKTQHTNHHAETNQPAIPASTPLQTSPETHPNVSGTPALQLKPVLHI